MRARKDLAVLSDLSAHPVPKDLVVKKVNQAPAVPLVRKGLRAS